MSSTTDYYQDRSPVDESPPPNLYHCDEHTTARPFEDRRANCQGTDSPKGDGGSQEGSSDSSCESAEEVYSTEEEGYFRLPGYMRESMSSFTGRPGIKGRNETIRMIMLCAVHFGITFTWGVEMTCT